MQKRKPIFDTKILAYCALLAALNVVLARLVIPMPNATTRFSIEAVPVFLAGMFFGPLAGGLVGFAGDFIGCLFSGYGYNPLFCVPPILYGVFGGLFGRFYREPKNDLILILQLILGFLPPILLGSVLYQSFALNFVYNNGAIAQFWIMLVSRAVQFSITMVLEIVIIYLLIKSRVFQRIGVWPPVEKN